MKESLHKKQYAFNKHLIFFAFVFAVLVMLTVVSALEGELWLAVGFGVFSLLPIFAFLFSPWYYIFSDTEVTIVYLFGIKDTICWYKVKSITEIGSWFRRGGGLPNYVLFFERKEKRPFFVNGEISKTLRTKKLIKKYWAKEIV